ncbi:unnamed protein product [Thlaspi arvense]|uniref:Phorbol-ester/DAG-type domain-containing protein n=1 Tax=Thlaspi arvense TaxID=13288 RepID=A0AAU9RLH8_THLAR|nr:unnamed protein product [Thlaspi arvense]
MELKGHDHSVGHYRGYPGLDCGACDRSDDPIGLGCYECDFTIHTKCAFVFNIQDTLSEHPAHDGHDVKLLTTGAPDHTDPKCHICGKNTKLLLFHCSTCNINMDIDCMVDAMCSRANLIHQMPWHYHPLLMLDVGKQMLCELCGKPGEYGFCCPRCRLMVHEKCASLFESPEITHLLHTKHSLKLLTQGPPDYTNPICHVCGKHPGNFLYHCDICKFNVDMVCAIESHQQHRLTPVALSKMKVHDEHTLTLIPRLISFICDACGKKGDRSPYVCLQCELMFFHQRCARLPRVIQVNRHDHRVSYTYPLGPGEWKCEVCLDEIDWSYGAYSCSICPSYALHSRCATRKDVWDGKELDGVPEEVEDYSPFKMNDDNTITHFAHEHNLSLNEDGMASEESILCEACVRPIGSNAFYNCSECGFLLHETCANLPKKKRHFLSPRPLTLCHNRDDTDASCGACVQMCCEGFMYMDGDEDQFDLLCTSITVPFIHESHPHPLLYLIEGPDDDNDMKTCQSCDGPVYQGFLGCIKCKYYLDFRCATLPLTVSLHGYYEHPLTLCYGEKASGKYKYKYWCDICEGETDPKTWFYTSACGATLHVYCLLGHVRYPKPGGKSRDGLELVFNNKATRPLCNNCHFRCPAPFFIVIEKELYCSYYCFLRTQMKASSIGGAAIRPPWVDSADMHW